MINNLSVTDIIGLLHVLGSISAFFLIYSVWNNLDRPGVRWSIVALSAGGGWAVIIGLAIAFDNTAVTVWLKRIQFIAGGVGAASIFLLAYENVYSEVVQFRYIPIVFVIPAITTVLLIFHPSAVVDISIADNGAPVIDEYGSWFFVRAPVAFGLTAIGGSFWLGSALSSTGRRRLQSATFVGAIVVIFTSAGLSVRGWPSPIVDTFVLGFIFASGIITLGLVWFNPFELNPAVMRTVINQIDEPMVVLTPEDNVATTNSAAINVLDTPSDPSGLHATELADECRGDMAALFQEQDVETTIDINIDGEMRYFNVNISEISYGLGSHGRVLVFRDITEQEQNRRDLELLKSVLSRVLRHNIRNELQTVIGYANMIAEQSDGEIKELAVGIADQATRLNSQSEKARQMEDIVNQTGRVSVDIKSVIKEACTPFGEVVEQDAATVTALAHPKLPVAIEELVENAVEHHEGTPSVRVSAQKTDDIVILRVSDDGSGIPKTEIRILNQGEETGLHHGSGVGLWLVKWIVERSGGDLNYEVTSEGTEVEIRLNRLMKDEK